MISQICHTIQEKKQIMKIKKTQIDTKKQLLVNENSYEKHTIQRKKNFSKSSCPFIES